MKYDCIIVGAGISGLTAMAYVKKYGYNALLLEKQEEVGGLVSSFNYKGFTFDGGIRAIENSGIVHPMLKQLGIEIEFLDSHVSLGIKDKFITIEGPQSVDEYAKLLIETFPSNTEDIKKIAKEIKQIMKYMDILYAIDNPIFLDFKKDWKYMITDVIPWMVKYAFTYKKIEKLRLPVKEYLATFTQNQELIDTISQHFFKDTPAFFALSYFSLYLDYRYPKTGTGLLIDKIEEYIKTNGGKIKTNTEIVDIDFEHNILTDHTGTKYEYKKLIWSADLTNLYKLKGDKELSKPFEEHEGGDSIFATYLTLDLPQTYFKDKCEAHAFYSPYTNGLSSIPDYKNVLKMTNKDQILSWVKDYFTYNTFEISIPSMRNEDLAPKGKTGVIISTLFDYSVIKHILDLGFYDEFKQVSESYVIDLFNETLFKDFKSSITNKFSSTPLTIQKRTGNKDGAITGWAFTKKNIPVEKRLLQIAQSVKTPFKDVYQSGQWTYSPSGLPISILTGKLAADRIKKSLK